MAHVTESTSSLSNIYSLFPPRNKNPILEGRSCAQLKGSDSQSPVQIGMIM